MNRADELRMSDSQVASSSLPSCGLTEPEAPMSPSRPIRKCKSELVIHDPSLDHHFDPLDRCTSDAFISPTSSSAPSKISISSTRTKRNSFHQRSKSLTHYPLYKADFMVPIPPSKVANEGFRQDEFSNEMSLGLSFYDEEARSAPAEAQEQDNASCLSRHPTEDGWGNADDVDVPPLPGTLRFPSMPGRPNKLVVVMVGLPARGKSFIGRKVCRFLVWLGHKTRVFNVGNYRRELETGYTGAEFFDPNNQEAAHRRHRAADLALTDMIRWLQEGDLKRNSGSVALFDATNSTQDRRNWVTSRVHEHGYQVMFLESYCDDEYIIKKNIEEHKVKSADYHHMTTADAVRDFKTRLAHYEEQYETITSPDDSWVKTVNAGSQIVVNNIRGYIPGRIVSFLTNVHTSPRAIYLCCSDNAEVVEHSGGDLFDKYKGPLGSDNDLSAANAEIAQKLAAFLETELPYEVHGERVAVWCSTLKRSVQMAAPIHRPYMTWHALDDIDYGSCNRLTVEQVGEQFPEPWHERRKVDPLHWRFPRGESVVDVINRLESIFVEVERQKQPVVIISHVTPLQILMNFFNDGSPGDSTKVQVPHGAVIRLLPHCYGCKVSVIPL